MKKRIVYSLLTFSLLGALTACSSTSTTTPSNTSGSGTTGTTSSQGTQVDSSSDADRVMVFAASRFAAPGVLEAFYCSNAIGVWESLLDDGPDGPMCVLAESYEMSDDAMTWTFHLKEGVVFHDGEPFNADAAIFNIERTKNTLSSGYTSLKWDRSYPNMESVEKVDDYTIQLNFSKPNYDLPITMNGYGSPMFSPACIGEDGNFIGTAAGTGPFKIIEEIQDQSVTVERFDDYWGEIAGTKYCEFRTIADADTRFMALKSEEVMGVIDLGAIEPNMAIELIKDEQFAIDTYKSTMTHTIAANGANQYFEDPRLLEAISLVIDRELIAETIFSGFAVATTNVLNHTSPYYIETPIEYDVERAVELAQEVLGGETIDASLVLRQKDCDRYPQESVAVYLKSVLIDLGINADILVMETELYDDTVSAGNTSWDLTVTKRQLPGATVEILQYFLASDGSSNATYNMGFSDPEIDALLESVVYETDPKKAQEIYSTLQTRLYDEKLTIAYVHDESIVAFNTKIGGFGLDPRGTTVGTAYWVE